MIHQSPEMLLFSHTLKEIMDLEDLEQIKTAMLRKVDKVNAIIEKRRNEPLAPGNLFVFKDVPFELVLIHRHPDDSNLWLAVVHDWISEVVGIGDVSIPEYDLYGPGVLRPNCNIWLKNLPLENRRGFLDLEYVKSVSEFLADLVQGKCDYSASEIDRRQQAEDDPDYQEWIAEVECNLERLVNETNRRYNHIRSRQ